MGEISEGGGPTNLTLSAAGLTIIYTAEKSKGCRHGGNGTKGFEGKKVYESQHAIVVSYFGRLGSSLWMRLYCHPQHSKMGFYVAINITAAGAKASPSATPTADVSFAIII